MEAEISFEPVVTALASWGMVLQVVWWLRMPARVARLQNPFADYRLYLQEHWQARLGLGVMSLAMGAVVLLVSTKMLWGWGAVLAVAVAAVGCVYEGRVEFQGWNRYERAASTYKWALFGVFVARVVWVGLTSAAGDAARTD